MDVRSLSNRLTRDELGIWRSSQSSPVSYPDDGNARCFQLEESSFWFRHRNDCILSAVKNFPPRGAIVDIGGGNGFVTERMIRDGFEAILLEPGPTGAWNAKVRRRIPSVICSTLGDAGFRRGSLAAAGVFDVLEHIEDDRSMVDRIHDLLMPGGVLYATVPAHQALWSLADVTARHYRRYNKKALTGLMGAKFEVLYFTYFFRPLVLPILLLRTLPYQLGLVKTGSVVSNEAEHGAKGGIATRIVARLLARERRKIESAVALRVGASCLLVARKRPAS